MQSEPQQEHRWLQRLVGEWTSETSMVMGPNMPPITSRGTDSVRSIGGLWVECEGRGEMPGGGGATSIFTFGYDPMQKRFVGTFIVSIMAYLWVYNGSLDAGGNMLTLDTKGPSFADPTAIVDYQDIIEFKSDDHRILTSRTPGTDGQWVTFMTAHYRRVK